MVPCGWMTPAGASGRLPDLPAVGLHGQRGTRVEFRGQNQAGVAGGRQVRQVAIQGHDRAHGCWEGAEPAAIITLNPSPEQRRDCRARGLPEPPLHARLVRVHLRGGEAEVLVSSILDEARLPTPLFAQSYRRRWSVQKCYKHQKRWLEVETFYVFRRAGATPVLHARARYTLGRPPGRACSYRILFRNAPCPAHYARLPLPAQTAPGG
jgi:hypothetical protein